MFYVILSLVITIFSVGLCQLVETIIAKKSKCGRVCGSYSLFRSLAGGPSLCLHQILMYMLFSTVRFIILMIGTLTIDYYIAITIWSGMWLAPYLLASISLSKRDDGLDIFIRELFKQLKLLIFTALPLCLISVIGTSIMFGFAKLVSSILVWLISTLVIMVAIWIFLGGPKRLVNKLKKKLTDKFAFRKTLPNPT